MNIRFLHIIDNICIDEFFRKNSKELHIFHSNLKKKKRTYHFEVRGEKEELDKLMRCEDFLLNIKI